MQAKRSCLLVFAALAACLSHAATVYVDAHSTAENPDGKSWDTAYVHPEHGYADLNVDGGVMNIAEGIYAISNTFNLTAANITIRGGWSRPVDGVSTCDPSRYQTIFSGLTAEDSRKVYWVREEPVFGQFKYASTELTTSTVLVDDKITFPDYTGEFDSYAMKCPKGVAAKRYFNGGNYCPAGAVWFQAGSSGRVEGCCFMAFSRTGSGTYLNGGVVVFEDAGAVTVSNCLFTAMSGTDCSGVMTKARDTVVADCVFRNCNASYGGPISVDGTERNCGWCTIRNCLFCGIRRNNPQSGNAHVISMNWTAYSNRIENCTFTRCHAYSAEVAPKGQVLCGNVSVENCVISNCFTSSTSAKPLRLIDVTTPYVNSGKDSWGGQLINCVVAHNRSEIQVQDNVPYVMIGRAKGETSCRTLYCGTLFKDNTFVAVSCSLSSGSYALGLVGWPGDASAANSENVMEQFLGCTFDDNHIVYPETAGVTPVISRGILTPGLAASSKAQLTAANCTFRGAREAGVYEIVQYGSGYSRPVNVLNCLFTVPDGGLSPDFPIYADKPSVMNVRNCMVQNLPAAAYPSDYAVLEGMTSDEVPAEEAEVLGSGRFLARPKAKTPGLRTSCDVALCSAKMPFTFQFRTSSDGPWQHFISGWGEAVSADPEEVNDPFGDARAWGSTTRGAVQALTDVAETGVTLTVRREPQETVTVSTPSTQAVASGDPIAGLLATGPEGSAFDGWYGEDGERYSSDNPLTIPSLESNLVLTVKFAGRKINLTFDLGDGGTFDGGGSTAVVESSEGLPFPEIPAYTMNEGMVDLGWTLPTTVPAEDTTYVNHHVTSAVRTVFVVPGGAGNRDGTDWANAYGDLATACADAGQYRGEVWMKEGAYALSAPVQMLPNVTVRGGFAGDETSADAADPASRPTILTGDANGDDVWLRNGAEEVGPVWTDLTFNEPNPDGADAYWSVGGAADDVYYAFVNETGCATNAAFTGLVFTGFARAAVSSTSGNANGLRLEGCRLLACGTGRVQDSASAIVVADCSYAVRDCVFTGNSGICRSIHTLPFTNSFSGCSFRANIDAPIYLRGQGYDALTTIAGCTFDGNYGDRTDAVALYLDIPFGNRVKISDTVFSRNRATGSGRAPVIIVGTVTADAYESRIVLDRCRFTENVTDVTADASASAGIRYTCRTSYLLVRDSYFGSNECVNANAAQTKAHSSSSCALSNSDHNHMVFVNTTFERNRASVASSAGFAATVSSSAPYDNTGLVHCTFADNEVSAASDSWADFLGSVTRAAPRLVFNTVFRSSAEGYRAVKFTGAEQLALSHSVIPGLESVTNGYTQIILYEDIWENDPRLAPSAVHGPNGALARGVTGLSPFARSGRVVCACTDDAETGSDNYYWQDPRYSTGSNARWRTIAHGNGKNEAEANAAGMYATKPNIPDAFGATRRFRRVALGPLNAPPLGLMIMVR